jgi:hypothetical protein
LISLQRSSKTGRGWNAGAARLSALTGLALTSCADSRFSRRAKAPTLEEMTPDARGPR